MKILRKGIYPLKYKFPFEIKETKIFKFSYDFYLNGKRMYAYYPDTGHTFIAGNLRKVYVIEPNNLEQAKDFIYEDYKSTKGHFPISI